MPLNKKANPKAWRDLPGHRLETKGRLCRIISKLQQAPEAISIPRNKESVREETTGGYRSIRFSVASCLD